MVKLKGPGLSEDAGGHFAKVLTFAALKSGNYLKKKTDPAQPRTPAQVGIRTCMKFLSQQWKTLSTAQMDTWLNRSLPMMTAPYHAYLSANATRFANFQMPAKEDPATEAGSGSLMKSCYVLTHYQAISYHARSIGPPINWAYILCRSQTSGFTPTPSNVIALFTIGPGTFTVYYDRPLQPGTYYYRCSGFDITGRLIAFYAELTATVT